MLGGRFTPQVDVAKLLAKRITISASTLRNRSGDYKANLIACFIKDFYQQLENGEIMPVIDSVFSWQQADRAHEKMANSKTLYQTNSL